MLTVIDVGAISTGSALYMFFFFLYFPRREGERNRGSWLAGWPIVWTNLRLSLSARRVGHVRSVEVSAALLRAGI